LTLSGKMVAIFVLVIVPLIFIVSNSIVRTGYYGEVIIVLSSIMLIVAPIIMFIIYPFYPNPFSVEKYFKRRGFENVVTEYEYVKKILHVAFALAIISTIVLIIAPPVPADFPYEEQEPVTIDKNTELTIKRYLPGLGALITTAITAPAQAATVIIVIRIGIFFVIYACLLKIAIQLSRPDFRLYFAKACFTIALKKEDEKMEKTKYLTIGLDNYNKYLRKNLKLHIKDLDLFCSEISFATDREKNDLLELFIGALEGDKFELLRRLLSFLKIQDRGHLLVKERIILSIKEAGTFAGAVAIPIVVAIIPILLKK
jgi:hypothetical protein